MPETLPLRTPWPANFPDVVTHTSVRTRDGHAGYQAAKAGDASAALTLADELLSTQETLRLRSLIGGRPALLLPVVAGEVAGFNAIPDAMAHILADRLDLTAVTGEIVQANKVGHTRAPAFQRLVTPALFEGPVLAVKTMCWLMTILAWAVRSPTSVDMSKPAVAA